MSDDAEDRVRSKTVITVISRIAERPVGKEACLVVIYGMELGKKFNLEGQTIIIGRSAKSDIQIDQESVSRNHAKIVNTGQNVIVVDLMCDPRTYEPSRFSSDGFHPSDSGYALMAELAYPALAGGSVPSPSSSCAQRSLLPVF